MDSYDKLKQILTPEQMSLVCDALIHYSSFLTLSAERLPDTDAGMKKYEDMMKIVQECDNLAELFDDGQ